MFRCALNALKCRSHSAEDVGVTSNFLAQSDNKGCDCVPGATTDEVDQNHHLQRDTATVSYFRISFSTWSWVMGQHAPTHDPLPALPVGYKPAS